MDGIIQCTLAIVATVFTIFEVIYWKRDRVKSNLYALISDVILVVLGFWAGNKLTIYFSGFFSAVFFVDLKDFLDSKEKKQEQINRGEYE